MNEMTEYYQSLKGLPKSSVPKKQGHKGNWSLVLGIGGIVQPVMLDKPYAMCVARKQQLEKDPSLRGKLKIVPFKQ